MDIAIGHRAREDQRITSANRYFFIDTDATTTLQFSYEYHQRASEALLALAAESALRYDLFLLCEADIPYDNTWDRSGDVARQRMQRRIEAQLITQRTAFHRIRGSVAQRVQQVEQILKGHTKLQPPTRTND